MSYSLLNSSAQCDKLVSKDLKIYCHHCIVLLCFEVEKYHTGLADREPWGREMLSEGGWGRQAEKEKPEHLVCQGEPQLPFRQCEVEPSATRKSWWKAPQSPKNI